MPVHLPRPSATYRLRASARVLALLLLLATIGFWAAKGAHRGWSQHRVPVQKTDEVTGIVFTEYEARFVPGVEVLAAGLVLATAIFGATFLLRSSPTRLNP
jgi:hypothetical protein